MNRLVEMAGGKPSAVVNAMIVGLESHANRDDFKINMSTFGMEGIGGICVGCAATCAVEQITGHKFTTREIEGRENRAVSIHVNYCDLQHFEDVIDAFRHGKHEMLKYICPNFVPPEPETELLTLNSRNLQDNLPAYKAYRDQLIAAGL